MSAAQTFASEEERNLVENAQSRAAASWGKKAILSLKNANVLVSGLSGLGAETTKNIMLTRINSCVLHDTASTTWSDLSSQFCLTEADIGANRAVASLKKIQELNPDIQVSVSTQPLLDFLAAPENGSRFNVVVLCDQEYEDVLPIAEYCHAHNIKVVVGCSRGVFGMAFSDFGADFECDDKNGEEFKECPISIVEPSGVVTVSVDDGITGHGLEDGDTVVFKSVHGLPQLNGQEFKVTVIHKSAFSIGSLAHFGEFHVTAGLVCGVKKPITMHFKSFQDSFLHPQFVMYDFTRMCNPHNLHLGFQALGIFKREHGHLPQPGNSSHAQEVVEKAKSLLAAGNIDVVGMLSDGLDEKLVTKLAMHAAGNLNPMAAILGGVMAQEAQKAVTGKFTPLEQWLYIDFSEALPDEPLSVDELAPRGCRYDGQIAVFGRTVQDLILNKSLFMIGCGALGCEYLKNFAMLGVGGGSGGIIVTDMDNIELSNLNRQFLFRKHHLGSMKSQIGAVSAQAMNSSLNVRALNEMVAPQTEHIFTPDFWRSQDIIVNALDNMKARLYVDQQCILNKKPLIEAGTESTKCNTAIIVPHFSVNYGYQPEANPPQPKSCTIKNFPFLIDHCIQWARENLFEGYFSQDPDQASKYLKDPSFFQSLSGNDKDACIMALDRIIGRERSETFEACVAWARQLFDDLYTNNPKDWQHSFPLTTQTKLGGAYWSGTKHFPEIQVFNPHDPIHQLFIATATALRAKTCGIAFPSQFPRLDSPDALGHLAAVAAAVPVRSWEPKRMSDEEGGASAAAQLSDPDYVVSQLPAPALVSVKPTSEDFEKDDDKNYHVDFLMCAANLRGRVYAIDPADRLKTKLFAGKVIPAIVTSTALITGFGCMEMLKMWSNRPNSALRQVSVNLGVSYFYVEEPLECPVWKYGQCGVERSFTLWDLVVTDVSNMTVGDYVAMLKAEHSLSVYAISFGVAPIFNPYMPSTAANTNKKFADVFAAKNIKHTPGVAVELVVNAYDDEAGDHEPDHLPKFMIKF